MSTSSTRLMRPVTDDPDTAGFFTAAADGRLAVRTCAECAGDIHLPTARCGACGAFSDTWRDVAGTGRLFSWTTVEHQIHPDYPVPYTVVLVELDDAPSVRLFGHLDGRHDLQVGQPMTAYVVEVDGAWVPQWSPAPETTTDATPDTDSEEA